ncbi:MAG: 1-(5-phosphoribosyl)-5-[(5-phosphoribosylamino)methylideneamino]imidazole-4-carboxamide isomerase [Bacteroidetes bacterium]|nr:1-(5-phosphoribosyl)-5-[(5-phosphoribosylamino)methylideneamino]imidazole-4-carboxamide isomerase [Bacteroidota bacterium]
MQIIPAIDLIDGKCVRLRMGDYADKTVYGEDPLAMARRFEAAGLRRLHLVDLDGAKAKHIVNGEVLAAICRGTSLVVDFGGGVANDTELERAFDLGAQMVTAGSIAAREPDTVLRWLAKHGAGRIILGADARDGKIAVGGWQETTSQEIGAFIRPFYEAGIRLVISTDIAKDGMLQGPSFGLYEQLLTAFPGLQLIASGGVTTAEDLQQLSQMGLHGAIVGKAYYEGRLTLADLAAYAH